MYKVKGKENEGITGAKGEEYLWKKWIEISLVCHTIRKRGSKLWIFPHEIVQNDNEINYQKAQENLFKVLYFQDKTISVITL